MASSETEICNIALGWVGGERIATIDEDSVGGKLCRDLYYDCRDAVLESRNWTFAMRRKVLTPNSAAPVFGFSQRFLIPSDCLRIVRLGYSPDLKERVHWEKEDNYILCDYETLYLRYISRTEDVVGYSSKFVLALACRLAADMAVPIAGSKSLQETMNAQYFTRIEEAGAFDGMQATNKIVQTNKLIRVR
jgi:hypothetical protein